ncbi:hypothetical protein SLOPH_1843 [Spraguea lophii 42_110]|uniref:Symplekin C-terminal domain-containing protein n=1 Tax=Spraguea lophii (strain 42_110) TaxID=1358809 RepID=S7XG37_SPRLO|nr:hypothetical protein SLOPH_1843 [Spraguea lophii 42_110]
MNKNIKYIILEGNPDIKIIHSNNSLPDDKIEYFLNFIINFISICKIEELQNIITSNYLEYDFYFYNIINFIEKKKVLEYMGKYIKNTESLGYFCNRLTPGEVFYEAHFVDERYKLNINECKLITKLCIDTLDDDILLQVLLRLENKTPVLFIRTIILCYQKNKKLKKFIENIIQKIIKRKIDKKHIKVGIIKLIEIMGEDGINIFYMLNKRDQEDILRNNKNIKNIIDKS